MRDERLLDMKDLVRKLFEIEDGKKYGSDYKYKCIGVKGYEKLDSEVPQVELTEFIEYFKENNLIEYIEGKIDGIQTAELYQSELHGIKHNIRVMLYTVYLAHKSNIPMNDIDLLVDAALYHDRARFNDREDDSHGLKSAERIEEVVGNEYSDIDMLKAIVEIHSIDDEKNASRIAEKYNIKDTKRFHMLYSIFKDADALDRPRVSMYNGYKSSLNPEMLRVSLSRSLVKVGHQVNEFFVENAEKPKIILDTDMENEIDDKFALTYLMQYLHKFDIEAITIAPFYGSKYSIIKDNTIDNIAEGVDASYDETLKLMDMIGAADHKDKVFKGATGVISNGYDEDNEAVNKIVEICNRNEKTHIIGIASLTNIALAIRKDPSIAKKANVIWLGGNDFTYDRNDEFNFRQDIQAVREVIDSGIDITLIPCVNVASILRTTRSELEDEIKGAGEIGGYLCDEYRRCKPEKRGKSKTIWDLAPIGYMVNKEWFEAREMTRPEIGEDGRYIFDDNDKPNIKVVTRISADSIYGDFFDRVNTIELKKYIHGEGQAKKEGKTIEDTLEIEHDER